MPPSLTTAGSVAVLDLGDGPNVFSFAWMDDVGRRLDEVLAGEVSALVTTASGRHYSNGLDLEWLSRHPDDHEEYLLHAEALLARVLLLPVPTVAAIAGHAFGAGAMLALAHDARVMRTERGYFCLPEVDLGMQFRPGMSALIQAKLPVQTVVESMTTGCRYGGEAAVVAQIVQCAVPVDRLGEEAVGLARAAGSKGRATLGGIKESLFGHVAALLRANPRRNGSASSERTPPDGRRSPWIEPGLRGSREDVRHVD